MANESDNPTIRYRLPEGRKRKAALCVLCKEKPTKNPDLLCWRCIRWWEVGQTFERAQAEKAGNDEFEIVLLDLDFLCGIRKLEGYRAGNNLLMRLAQGEIKINDLADKKAEEAPRRPTMPTGLSPSLRRASRKSGNLVSCTHVRGSQ